MGLFDKLFGGGRTEEVSSKRLSEPEAVQLFFYTKNKELDDQWDDLLKALRRDERRAELLKDLDESKAKLDLMLAAVAVDLIALDNLFPPGRAERLNQITLKSFPEEFREYANEAISEYCTQFKEALSSGLNPMQSMGEIFFGRWGLAGDEYPPPVGQVFIPRNQLAAMALTSALCAFLGGWKRINDTFEIVEGEGSFDIVD